MNKQFIANKLILNFGKIDFRKLIINKPVIIMHISYSDQYIQEVKTTKLLCLQIYNVIWKRHVELILRKLNATCFKSPPSPAFLN